MTKNNLTRRDFIRKGSGISAAALVIPPAISAPATFRNTDSDHPGSGINEKGFYSSPDAFEFLNPGTAYRGISLWFFNDRLDKDDILSQLKAMRQAGWGAVMPRRYTGLFNPAYGKTWNETTKIVIKACNELDMKVYLPEIDKNGWYSAAPTSIPGMRDEYRNKSLIRRSSGESAGKNEKLIAQIGEYSYYQYTSYPKEGWENSFCYLDLLDRDVVNAYYKVTFEFFDTEFGKDFGKTVEGIWIAEPHIMMGQPKTADCLPWTSKLPEIFEKEWGYSLLENLNLLYQDIGDYRKVRYHYWRTLGGLLADYSKITEEWCNKYNLKFTGHLMGEDSFISQLQYTVNCMPLYEYMHIPGIDHLTMDLNWPNGVPFILTPKQVSSVAHQLGRKEVISELYGCCDGGLSFQDQKRVYQWLALMGINYRCYHGAFLSMRGTRKRVYPPNLNYQQPYWDKSRIIGDFGARLSYILGLGGYKADVLIIHPMESYYLQGKIKKELSKELGTLDRALIELSHNLLKIQCSYDYGDETILSRHAKVKGRKFFAGEMEYKVVIIPSINTLRKSTVKLLQEFAAVGGIILSTGTLPSMIDGEVSSEIETVNKKVIPVANEPEALRKALNKYSPPEISIRSLNDQPSETIWVQQRNTNNGKIFFIVNTDSGKTVDTEIRIIGSGRLENWNLENGQIEIIAQNKREGYTETRLKFSPDSSFVLFRNDNASPVEIKGNGEKILWKKSAKEFHLKREDPNSLTLDFCRYRKGSGELSELLPVQGIVEKLHLEKYNGPVSLQFKFLAERKPSSCDVVIEEADKYAIKVNGNEVKYEGLPYYRDRSFLPIRISHLINTGTNYIEVSREFQPADDKVLGVEDLGRFYGTELEQIYLTGDFAVKGEFSGKDYFETVRYRFKPRFTLTNEKNITSGDLLLDGYCFFNGTLRLTTEIIIPEIKVNEKYYLEIEKLEAVVSEVEINSQNAGKIAWKPYRIDITDYVWKGENKVVVSLTNSLRNLLGEMHFIPLERYKNTSQWSEKVSPRLADGSNWLDKRKKGTLTSWSDDYYFRPFGIEGGISVICTENNLEEDKLNF